MWHTQESLFNSKAEAFSYLNSADAQLDTVTLYFKGEIKYVKNFFGIFDWHFQTYILGNLPVEIYN